MKLISYTDLNDFEQFFDVEQVVCSMTDRNHSHELDPAPKADYTTRVLFKSGGYLLTYETPQEINERILSALA